jgi:integrase
MRVLKAIWKGLTFHSLRHTVPTKLADAGASTRVIQSITGHATPQQVETYVATANKKRLAKRGIALIDQNKV